MKNVLTALLILLVGCSSKEKMPEDVEHDDIKKDYLVRDSSDVKRPGWITDADIWAEGHDLNTRKYRYFSYETGPKISRAISCDLAKAHAKELIAGEITSYIDKTLSTVTEGDAAIDENNPQLRKLNQYVENRLFEKVQALVHGAAIRKIYWEKRQYKKDMGAAKDYKAYICAVFIRMETERLAAAIDRAADHVSKESDGTIKNKVKAVMDQAASEFKKKYNSEI